MHCNPDGSASDGCSGRVCGPAEARTSGPRTQDPGHLGQKGGREGTPKRSTPHAADARDAARGFICTKLRRCKRAEEDPSVGHL